MNRHLAEYLERYYDENRDRLRWMFYGFNLAAVSMVVEVVSWILDIVR